MAKLYQKLGKLSVRKGIYIVILFLIIFTVAIFLQSKVNIAYSLRTQNEFIDTFGDSDRLVILYDNQDETAMATYLQSLQNDSGVVSVNAYSTTIGKEVTASELATLANIDPSMVNMLYYLYTYGNQTNGMTLQGFIGFILNNIATNPTYSAMFDTATLTELNQFNSLIQTIETNQSLPSQQMAAITQMDETQVAQIYTMSGNTTMTVMDFVGFILNNSTLTDAMTQDQIAGLTQLQTLGGLILNETLLTAEQLTQVFPSTSPLFTTDTINMLYVMYYSGITDVSQIKISMVDFFQFVNDNIITNTTYSMFLDDTTLATFNSSKEQMDSAMSELVGPNESRAIIELDYVFESDAMYQFYDQLTTNLDTQLQHSYYLVGESAMSYEMSQTFRHELLFIMMLTILAIFTIVAITFRKIIIPVILVFLIQGGVFITMSVMFIAQINMYYLALLIVQALLMGATIDYGILFTTYYREFRQTHPIKETLQLTYKEASHTILTSSSIMIFVTGILSFLTTGEISQILFTVAVGALSATTLIFLVLPSLLVTFDMFVLKKKKLQ